MPMPDVTAQFQQVSQKLTQLLKLQEHALRENEKLRREKEILQSQLVQAKGEVTLLRDQLAIVQSASGQMDEKSKKAFEKKINQYLQDIDGVIARLTTS